MYPYQSADKIYQSKKEVKNRISNMKVMNAWNMKVMNASAYEKTLKHGFLLDNFLIQFIF